MRREQVVAGGIREHPHLVALITYHGQVFHLAGVAFYIGADTHRRRRRPDVGARRGRHRRALWSYLALQHQREMADSTGETAGQPLDGPGDLVAGPAGQ